MLSFSFILRIRKILDRPCSSSHLHCAFWLTSIQVLKQVRLHHSYFSECYIIVETGLKSFILIQQKASQQVLELWWGVVARLAAWIFMNPSAALTVWLHLHHQLLSSFLLMTLLLYLGKTYPNSCTLFVENNCDDTSPDRIRKAYDGECKANRSIDRSDRETCIKEAASKSICYKMIVCGTDGIVYNSPCLLEAKNKCDGTSVGVAPHCGQWQKSLFYLLFY